MNQGCEVMIASDGRALLLLKKEFPDLKFFELPAYNIEYPERTSMIFKMLAASLKITSGINKERKATERIVEEENVDIVFSDNRYGCRSDKALSVFMTHQLFIQCPAYLKWGEPLLFAINKKYFSKFDSVWVPDFENGANLSGQLSHKRKINKTVFVGPLSRFGNKEKTVEAKYELTVVCSGPEPQRTIFENLLRREISKAALNTVLVRGITEGSNNPKEENNLLVFDYLESGQLEDYILSSDIIISRPGYSSIMDLAVLGKKAVFIPTPGQTEQEYLGNYFHENKIFFSQTQNRFNLTRAIQMAASFTGTKTGHSNRLSESIKDLLQQTKK